MTHENAWTQAQIHFRRTPGKDGQNLGDGRVPQHQTSADVRLENGWLHIRQANREEIVTIPADAVDYILTQS